MDMAMNISVILIALGCSVGVFGMLWAMIDGRLFNNPGEGVMFGGLWIALVGLLISFVTAMLAMVQCAATIGCSFT